MDSGSNRAHAASDSVKSVAVLYFENLSGAKEDEYFRDGITEDIITELSNISGLKTFSRATILPWRDKQMTPAQVAQVLGCPVGTARSHASRGVARLRQILSESVRPVG